MGGKAGERGGGVGRGDGGKGEWEGGRGEGGRKRERDGGEGGRGKSEWAGEGRREGRLRGKSPIESEARFEKEAAIARRHVVGGEGVTCGWNGGLEAPGGRRGRGWLRRLSPVALATAGER